MRNHLISIGLGVVMGVVGLALFTTTRDVSIPVVSLSKIGFILMVLGAIEVVVSTIALAVPSTRHRDYPL